MDVIFVNRAINNTLPSIFNDWFKFCSEIHNYETSSTSKDHLYKQSYRTNAYGKFSVKASAIESWNKTQDQMGGILLKDQTPSKIKILMSQKYIDSY